MSTGYPAAWFGVAAFLLLTAVLSVVGGAKLLVDIVGFVYPAYQSFKSMDSVTATSTGDDTQWLTYWVVFSFLTILETVFGFLTVLIPFYYWIKIAVLVVRACVRACCCFDYFLRGFCLTAFFQIHVTTVDVVSDDAGRANHLRTGLATQCGAVLGKGGRKQVRVRMMESKIMVVVLVVDG